MGFELLEGVGCSSCGSVGSVERFSRDEEVVVRGLKVLASKVLRRCTSCEAEFENTGDGDYRDAVYAQYRAAKGMVTPEAFRTWRENYGLKQADVTALLGWGEVTLGRYENGSLQSEAHDRMMADLMLPGRLSEAFAQNPGAVPIERRVYALARLRSEKGLLTPEELRVVRVKYGLDVNALGAIISVTPSLYAAWENGESVQSASVDSFIRLIARRPDIVRDLLEDAGLLSGTTLEVLTKVEADVDRRVSEVTGSSLSQVKRVGEGYRLELPKAADRLSVAA